MQGDYTLAPGRLGGKGEGQPRQQRPLQAPHPPAPPVSSCARGEILAALSAPQLNLLCLTPRPLTQRLERVKGLSPPPRALHLQHAVAPGGPAVEDLRAEGDQGDRHGAGTSAGRPARGSHKQPGTHAAGRHGGALAAAWPGPASRHSGWFASYASAYAHKRGQDLGRHTHAASRPPTRRSRTDLRVVLFDEGEARLRLRHEVGHTLGLHLRGRGLGGGVGGWGVGANFL